MSEKKSPERKKIFDVILEKGKTEGNLKITEISDLLDGVDFSSEDLEELYDLLEENRVELIFDHCFDEKEWEKLPDGILESLEIEKDTPFFRGEK